MMAITNKVLLIKYKKISEKTVRGKSTNKDNDTLLIISFTADKSLTRDNKSPVVRFL